MGKLVNKVANIKVKLHSGLGKIKRSKKEIGKSAVIRTSIPDAIDSLSLPELIEVSDVAVTRSKGIYQPLPRNFRTKTVIRRIEVLEKKNPRDGRQLINRVNKAIVAKNRATYAPSEKARLELQKLMSDDE